VKAGKSLDDIQKEVKVPEYASWASQDRMPTNIEAACRMSPPRDRERSLLNEYTKRPHHVIR
jgi:hypothetical protein